MKGRIIVAVTIALVMSISAITANVRWSKAQQGEVPVGEARQASDQVTPVTPGAEETPVPGGDFNSNPVMFIENAGQWDDGARFQVWGGPAGTMWLAEDAIWITVLQPGETSRQVDKEFDPRLRWPSEDREDPAPRRGVNIKLSFVGATPYPRIETYDRLDTKMNYFLGNDSTQWRPEVSVWGGVRYGELYPGVDLELTSKSGGMVSRLIAQPGADLSDVRLRVEGAAVIGVDQSELQLTTPVGTLALPLPQAGFSFQVVGKSQRGQTATWAAMPSATTTFRSLTPADNLVDPLYATFLGGNHVDSGNAIAVDEAGSAYVTGSTYSNDFPTTPGAFDPSFNGGDCDGYPCYHAFVVKLNPAGSGLTYATFLGGSSNDEGNAITVDETGSVYVTGETYSSDFPTTPDAFDPSFNSAFGSDTFVAKLNPAGSNLAYATFLGGESWDLGYGIAVVGEGNAYVVGWTKSGDFPTTPGAFDRTCNGDFCDDSFVVNINPTGSELGYATFLGGSSYDEGRGIAVDGAGSAYVTGWTRSSDFPTTPDAFDPSYNSTFGGDTYVVKLNPAGNDLVYATFLGGSSADNCGGIAVDEAGSAYMAGSTYSGDFPTTPGAFDPSFNGGDYEFDTFVAKLSPAGSDLVYATFLGGSNSDVGSALAVAGEGSAYVVGWTQSSDFPTTPGAFDPSPNGSDDAFVAKLNPTGSVLVYATYLGGIGQDFGKALAVSGEGSIYAVGNTGSFDFPTTPQAFDPSLNVGADAFVVKLSGGPSSIYLPIIVFH